MNYATQETWMGNVYGVESTQEKREVTTSMNTTPETNHDQPINVRMPDIIVPNYVANDREKKRLNMGNCRLIECVHAGRYFGMRDKCWLSLGYADIVEVEGVPKKGAGKVGEKPTTYQECEFKPLSYKSLMAGIMPEYALLKLAWSKNCGSVFEEVSPFKACCVWAGRRDALYVGRDTRGAVQYGAIPIHGVDYIVLPMSQGCSEQREILLKEYIEKLQQDVDSQTERKERLKDQVGLIEKVVSKLDAMLEADAEERARAAEEEEVARREREQALRDMALGPICGLMTVKTYSNTKALR